MSPSRFHWLKCEICGVEVERIRLLAHHETSHPDYVQWRKHQAKLVIYVMSSCGALTVVDMLYVRFYTPYFLDVVVAFALGTLLLQIPAYRRKIRELRDAWNKTHPTPMQQDST